MFSCRLRRYPVISDLELYHHPEDYDTEIENEEFIEFANDTVEYFACDACDKVFPYENEYEMHMSQHKVCNLDGCTFSAHEKIIERHIRLQHSTGLYDKIRNISTPEDINKWIQERKQKYPNKTNIQKRYEEQEEQFKRGERIMESKKRFAENNRHRLIKIRNKKMRGPQTKTKRKKTLPATKIEKSIINENNHWNKMFPFKGTINLYNQDIEKEEKYEDDEWDAPNSNNTIVLNNALGALMGAYMSDDESDDVSLVTNATNAVLQESLRETQNKNNDECVFIETSKSEDEPPTEIKFEKIQQEPKHENINNKNKNETNINRRCIEKKRVKTNASIKPSVFYFKKRKITLLEKLLESNIRTERNILLQCVRHVVDKNFFM